MMINVGTQYPSRIAWNGTAGNPIDIRQFNWFAWTFEVGTDLTADTIFNVMAHNPLPTDVCAPDAPFPVEEVSICDIPAVPGPQATITLPAGTVAGTLCSGTIPCRPAAFVSLAAAGGDTSFVNAAITLGGPR